jgi:Fe-S cluster assembly protein SufD
MFQLKEKLLSSFIAFENQKDIDSYVHGIRTKAIKNFEKEGFPTKKLENWKYTSLKKTLNHDYKLFPTTTEALEFKDIKDFLIDDIESYKIIFVVG